MHDIQLLFEKKKTILKKQRQQQIKSKQTENT